MVIVIFFLNVSTPASDAVRGLPPDPCGAQGAVPLRQDPLLFSHGGAAAGGVLFLAEWALNKTKRVLFIYFFYEIFRLQLRLQLLF